MIITAPEEAVVSVGGVELSEHELKEKGIPYDSYEDNAFNRAGRRTAYELQIQNRRTSYNT